MQTLAAGPSPGDDDNIFCYGVSILLGTENAFERTFALLLEDHSGWAEEALALGYFESLVGFCRVTDDLNLLAFSKELSFGERRSNEVTWPLLGIRLVEA